MVESMETTSVLPDDVIEEILVRLPVKHLLSLKCVYQGDSYLLSKRQGVDAVLNLTPYFDRDIPSACSNDLYLRKLALWNPATREFKEVTRWPLLLANETTRFLEPTLVGFGFDIQANDFKILLVIYNVDNPRNEVYELHLYSLMADSWKRIKKLPSSLTNFCYSRTDTYLNNGVIYWLTLHSRHYWILSFNLSTETFKESKLPEGCGCDHERVPSICMCPYKLMIGKYKEGLAIYVTGTSENRDSSIEIWAVSKFSDDDNGVPLSWQHVCTIGPIQSFKGLEICTVRVCGDLLQATKCGEGEHFLNEQEGCVYDPSTRTFNFFHAIFWSSFTYVESLYCLLGRIH